MPGVDGARGRALVAEPILRLHRPSPTASITRSARASRASSTTIAPSTPIDVLVARAGAPAAQAGALRCRDRTRASRCDPDGGKKSRYRGELTGAGDEAITLKAGDAGEVRIPYDSIVRANLIDEGLTT